VGKVAVPDFREAVTPLVNIPGENNEKEGDEGGNE
jgi:hypothetical protein